MGRAVGRFCTMYLLIIDEGQVWGLRWPSKRTPEGLICSTSPSRTVLL